ncbi:hypothetical protein SAMD00023353_3301190 [Rosellinia necatrix]|uniref:Uncharacterized protein n=1 Tax=Rosellinia necatrix TaxID=77044 RepID=A0A1S8A8P6_ROSNE|nr:hypothetical protein SAMD00023353_3301190 [Rosellinia necatrix]
MVSRDQVESPGDYGRKTARLELEKPRVVDGYISNVIGLRMRKAVGGEVGYVRRKLRPISPLKYQTEPN